MPGTPSLVYVVDDDESVRRALRRLLHSWGLRATTFASATEFLDSGPCEEDACLIADIRMPGLGGLDLQRELLAKGSTIPVIFITAFDTAETRKQARALGAAGYFRKPVDDQALLDAIRWALSKNV
jgi:FixJ family two-component response regulator